MSLFPLDLWRKYKEIHKSNNTRKTQHPVFPDRCDADAQNNSCRAKDKSKADNIFLWSIRSSFQGRRFSLGPTSPPRQLLPFRWRSLKMHVCTTMWGTPRDSQDLTDTIFTSRHVHVQHQEKRRESVQGASINHAPRAAVVCMQDNYILSYQQCRNPNATFHSLQKTGKYISTRTWDAKTRLQQPRETINNIHSIVKTWIIRNGVSHYLQQ